MLVDVVPGGDLLFGYGGAAERQLAPPAWRGPRNAGVGANSDAEEPAAPSRCAFCPNRCAALCSNRACRSCCSQRGGRCARHNPTWAGSASSAAPFFSLTAAPLPSALPRGPLGAASGADSGPALVAPPSWVMPEGEERLSRRLPPIPPLTHPSFMGSGFERDGVGASTSQESPRSAARNYSSPDRNFAQGAETIPDNAQGVATRGRQGEREMCRLCGTNRAAGGCTQHACRTCCLQRRMPCERHELIAI